MLKDRKNRRHAEIMQAGLGLKTCFKIKFVDVMDEDTVLSILDNFIKMAKNPRLKIKIKTTQNTDFTTCKKITQRGDVLIKMEEQLSGPGRWDVEAIPGLLIKQF